MTTPKSSFEQHLEKLKADYKAQLPGKIDAILNDWRTLLGAWKPELMIILHRNVHSLIGTSGTFGFTDISKTARNLETLLKPMPEDVNEHYKPDEYLCSQIETIISSLQKQTATQSSETAEATNTAEAADTTTPTETNEPPKISETTVDTSLNATNVQLAENRNSGTVAQDILIYYLDDEIASPELLIQNLISYGFKSKHFRTMAQLLEAIQHTKPSLVILDLMMPNVTTDSVFNLARTIVKLDIKVIILSGSNDFNNRLEAVRADVGAYMVKPADIPSLVSLIRNLLKLNNDRPPHIMIVDDQASVAKFHALILENAGMQVTIETNPLHVLDALEIQTPDLLLLDLNMPIVNGDELAAVIRQHEQYQSIPILFLSAEIQADTKTRLLEIGSDDLLPKGMQPAEFIRQVKSRVERSKILTAMMYQDSLTGLLNHAQIQLAAERVFQQCKRKNLHFCIAMIDIDFFKKVNDTYGHLTGDRVITAVAQLLQQRLRTTDYIGRFGGEEFMLVLPDININDAGNLINSLRKSFSLINFKENGVRFNVSFSAGIAESIGMKDFVEQTKMADEALYRAKHRGRNIVCASFSGESED
jgi:diguanylate cyclase (GGDEF)-like protein